MRKVLGILGLAMLSACKTRDPNQAGILSEEPLPSNAVTLRCLSETSAQYTWAITKDLTSEDYGMSLGNSGVSKAEGAFEWPKRINLASKHGVLTLEQTSEDLYAGVMSLGRSSEAEEAISVTCRVER